MVFGCEYSLEIRSIILGEFMREYVIFTDSACDVSPELLSEWGVKCIPLNFRFADSDKLYFDNEIPAKEFYDKMRGGAIAKTSALNAAEITATFEEVLKAGQDVFYLAFSSGLSTTFNSSRIAAVELSEKYPDSKVVVVDSLSASAGEGLFLKLVCDKKAEGLSIDELTKFAKKTALSVCHWFTVDDLVYLKRGGRISAAAAFFGNALGIKPVLHVDDAGHLVNVAKVRGRKASIIAMAEKLSETALDKENGLVYISHADCIDDANFLASILNDRYGVKVDLITNIGTVIGAHSGPGTLALFFVGSKR